MFKEWKKEETFQSGRKVLRKKREGKRAILLRFTPPWTTHFLPPYFQEGKKQLQKIICVRKREKIRRTEKQRREVRQKELRVKRRHSFGRRSVGIILHVTLHYSGHHSFPPWRIVHLSYFVTHLHQTDANFLFLIVFTLVMNDLNTGSFNDLKRKDSR